MNPFTMIRDHIHSKSIQTDLASKERGEVFTPRKVIDQMVELLGGPWDDPDRTFFDPTSNVGHMPAAVGEKLFEELKHKIPNEKDRFTNIIERQLFMSEIHEDVAIKAHEIFSINGKVFPNIHVGSTLTMPDDFFDLSPEQRMEKYPDRCPAVSVK
jgi:type I restriction-modification system DNA methylase subunit